MNKEQQELVDRGYDKYLTYLDDNQIFINSLDIDSFMRACTKDSEDANMWGLTIEERELSSQERNDLYNKTEYNRDIFPTDENGWNKLFDDYNIPTKLITVIYNDKKIESYE